MDFDFQRSYILGMNQTLAWTSSMYRLPVGKGGTDALSICNPTPTLLSAELSYIETRHATGVVPSGNSKGNSAGERKNTFFFRIIQKTNWRETTQCTFSVMTAISILRWYGECKWQSLAAHATSVNNTILMLINFKWTCICISKKQIHKRTG